MPGRPQRKPADQEYRTDPELEEAELEDEDDDDEELDDEDDEDDDEA